MENSTKICYELIISEDKLFLEYLITRNLNWTSRFCYSIIKRYNIFDDVNDVYYYIYLSFLQLKKIKKEMFEKYWFKKLIIFLIKQQMIALIRQSKTNKQFLWSNLIEESWVCDERNENFTSNDHIKINNKLEASLLLERNSDLINKFSKIEKKLFEDYFLNNFDYKQLRHKYMNWNETLIKSALAKIKRTLKSFRVE